MSRMQEALVDWWVEVSQSDAAKAAEKAADYGSYDLVVLGHTMADLIGFKLDPETDPHAVYAELGIHFYELGKVARAMGALKDGRMPSDDTLHDFVVYAMMVRRIRQVGGWPHAPEPDTHGLHAVSYEDLQAELRRREAFRDD